MVQEIEPIPIVSEALHRGIFSETDHEIVERLPPTQLSHLSRLLLIHCSDERIQQSCSPGRKFIRLMNVNVTDEC